MTLRLRLVRDAVRHGHELNDPYADNATAFVVTGEGMSRHPSRYPARGADALGCADAHTTPGTPTLPGTLVEGLPGSTDRLTNNLTIHRAGVAVWGREPGAERTRP